MKQPHVTLAPHARIVVLPSCSYCKQLATACQCGTRRTPTPAPGGSQ